MFVTFLEEAKVSRDEKAALSQKNNTITTGPLSQYSIDAAPILGQRCEQIVASSDKIRYAARKNLDSSLVRLFDKKLL